MRVFQTDEELEEEEEEVFVVMQVDIYSKSYNTLLRNKQIICSVHH